MSDANSEGRDPYDLPSFSAEIDAICDRFEAAWKAGQRPRIEECLAEVPEGARRILFRELLKVEIHWRSAAGELPKREEYHRHFPAFSDEIESLLPSADDRGGHQVRRAPPLPEQLRAGDRNLLFGILALQMDFISRDALVAAMNAWVLSKHKPLGEILVEQNALSQADYDLLAPLVEAHIRRHNNDPQQSLAAISSLSDVTGDFRGIGDPGIQATLDHVVAARRQRPDESTESYSVGVATSAGTRFRILRPHAEGGLGRVSVARDEELNREVALKEIKSRQADQPESRARFLLEAEVTGGLEHPNIIPVYGLGQYADGRPFYAMRFIRGDNLKDACGRFHTSPELKHDPSQRAVEFRKLLRRFLNVCNAIDYAHHRGVLHRDLKPGNIMLGKYGETLVVDWGLAKLLSRPETDVQASEGPVAPPSASGSGATQMGSMIGTPAYMSPEQAAGRIDLLGPASDVYSLGATLYYLLTNRAPFDGSDVGAVLQKVQRGEFPAPRKMDATIDRPLEAICLEAMALKPENRYATPRAMADDIEHWLADEPVTAYREPLRTRVARWGRKHKTLVAGAFGLVTAAAIALTVSTVLIKQEQILADKARQQADENAHRADEETKEVIGEKTKVETEKKKSQRRLALSYIDRGANELEHGDPLLGYAILGQAYRATSDLPDLRRGVCSLLAAWNGVPPLKHDNGVRSASLSPDGSKIVTCDDHAARIWDVATGKPFGTPIENEYDVVAASFSPDGTKIVTASWDQTARLWDVATGKPLGPPLKHDEVVRSASFSPDGTKIATASDDQTARLWDVATGKPLGPPLKHDKAVVSASFSPDDTKIATVSDDHTARLWDVATGKPFGPPLKHNDVVRSATFSPDGTKIATASLDQTARLWDVATGKPFGPPLKHDGGVQSASFSPDGTKIVTASDDHTARLWDVATGKPFGPPLKHDGGVQSASFSPDGTKIATASSDQTARLWDVATGKPLGPPLKHDEAVRWASFSPDGTKIATASDDQPARLWDVATGKPLGPPLKHDLQVLSALFSPDGTKIATASWDKTARLWDVATGRPFAPPLKHNDVVRSATFSPDGTKIVTASDDHTARLWDVATGKPFGPPLKHDGGVLFASFSPDGTKIATASDDQTARLWDVATGKPLGPPLIYGGRVLFASFSPDGTKIATASDDGTTRLWDVVTLSGEPSDLPVKYVRSVSFSPDGTKIATASWDKTARLWDVATGKPFGPPLKHDGGVQSASFGPDGTKIVTASDDHTARLWDVATGKPLGPPLKHDGQVLSASFSPDGTKIATASLDGTARLWDVATGKPLGPPLKHNDVVRSATFSPDGTKIATASLDGTARLWDVTGPVSDDSDWIAAYVKTVSLRVEEDDSSLHVVSVAEFDAAWHEVLKSPERLKKLTEGREMSRRALHIVDADDQETAKNWFAAAFHLRWLAKLEPNNVDWRQRLAKVEEHLK